MADRLHQSVRVLLHFTQFCIKRQVRHKPCGPWDHMPPHVWAVVDDPSNVSRDDCGDNDEDVCALCCHSCLGFLGWRRE